MGEPVPGTNEQVAETENAVEDKGKTINDQFWQINGEQIKAGMQSLAGEIGPEMLERCMQREQNFTLQVCQLVADCFSGTSERDPAVMLFDIDDTLASMRESSGGVETVLRPSAAPLFEQILAPYVKAKKLKVGILSNRPQDNLKKETGNKGLLGPLAKTLDNHCIYSTRKKYDQMKQEQSMGLDAKAYVGENYVAKASVLNPTSLSDGSYAPAVGDIDKLDGIAEVRRKNKGQIMVVDDLPYASHLDPNSKLSGKSLKDSQSQFNLFG